MTSMRPLNWTRGKPAADNGLFRSPRSTRPTARRAGRLRPGVHRSVHFQGDFVKIHHRAAGVLTFAALFAGHALAQTPAPAAPPAAPAKATMNPKAVERLKAMGAHLRTLKAFTVTADVTNDLVLDNGQKVEATSTVEISARMPNLLMVSTQAPLRSRKFYYDGKTVTVFGEKLGYYGQFTAPDTIVATLEGAAKKYGVEVPLADLFFFGTEKSNLAAITEALYTGPQRVGGVLCDNFAFRQPDVDWQVCIQRGKEALPRKLVITSTDVAERPQRRSVLTWKPGSAPAAAAFTFKPPKDAKRIAVKEAAS
jgi:hypothetical protein